ncbi:glycosyltransferase family 2 protein [Bacillus cereus group sp. N14]|uniref:glycosyltransferase family 2 protein n=1 Tax=Bacillus cereus group sp. N14 TaxID=2794587 RepID=UPI0018F3C274|nr:glycosyltransferase family 2 protein [Bacillus cereus group sp. N14]MBJ8083343.1 glycosyltransferase family 2 protein [Bacillus cereus group sp. N14]
MKFSLIMATCGRRDDILDLLKSLKQQTYKNFELIVVDQNDIPISELFEEYTNNFSINYIYTPIKGLSRARNIGLQVANGDIIAFPDDDCIYETNVLESIVATFNSNAHIQFISTNTTNIEKTGSLIHAPDKDIILNNKYGFMGPSFALFFTKQFVQNVGTFNEDLGVGSGTIYGAGEETDFVLRGMKKNYIGLFRKNLFVYHPVKEDTIDEQSLNRAISYAGGFGKVICLHYGFPYLLRAVVAAIFRMMQNIFNDKRKFHANRVRGIIRGYFK